MNAANPDSPTAADTETVRTAKPAKCKRWRFVAILLAVFACGLIVGSAATVYSVKQCFFLRPKDPQSIPERLTRRLRRELDLTDTQAQQVQGIFVLHMQQIMAIREQVRPQFEAQFDAVRHEVAQVLSGDQVSRWEQWFDDFRQRRRDRWKSFAPQSSHAQEDTETKPDP